MHSPGNQMCSGPEKIRNAVFCHHTIPDSAPFFLLFWNRRLFSGIAIATGNTHQKPPLKWQPGEKKQILSKDETSRVELTQKQKHYFVPMYTLEIPKVKGNALVFLNPADVRNSTKALPSGKAATDSGRYV